jgi:hypothetical protein
VPDTTKETEERRITLRVTPALAIRVDAAVEREKSKYPKFSMNDWIVRSMRNELDGARPVSAVETGPPQAVPEMAPFGKSVTEHLNKGTLRGEKAVLKRDAPWVARLTEMAARWGADPASVSDDLNTMLGGRVPPAKFARWAQLPKVRAALAAWLEAEYP